MLIKKSKCLIAVFAFAILMQSTKSYSQFDSMAVSTLDNMSMFINGIKSCSFKIDIEYDKYSNATGLIKHSNQGSAFMRGPNKLRVNSIGDNGLKEFYYNGKDFVYYSKDNNQYSTLPAPSTNIETIDMLSNDYGFDFPAADFFYPYFVDDLIEASNNLIYLGNTMVNGKECFHIAGTAKDGSKTYQFWILNDQTFLPVKLVIVYTGMTGNPQYEAIISDWEINPSLNDDMFEFKAPADSKSVILKKKN